MNLYDILDNMAKYAAEQKPNTGYTSKVITAVRGKCERGEYPDGTNVLAQIALQFDGRETPEDLTDIGADEKRSPYGASFSLDGAMDCMDWYRNTILAAYGFNCGDSTQLAYNKNKGKQVPWEERRELDLYLSKLSNKAGHPDATHAMMGIGKPKMLHTTSKSNPLRVEDDTKYSVGTRTGTGCFRILSDDQHNASIYNRAAHMLKPQAPDAPINEHIVSKGDTLGSIAKKYGTTADMLAELNNIANPNIIKCGQHIKLPTPKPVTPNKPTLNRLLKLTYTTKGRVNVRESASLSSARIGTTSGKVTALFGSGDFIKVRYGSGFGYIHMSVLTRNEYMRGDDVKALQQMLGFAEKDCDGVLGLITAAGISGRQAALGLKVDATVGEITWTNIGGQWIGK